MKRLLLVLAVLVIGAGSWWLWSGENRSYDVLISNAQAARAENESGTVRVFLTIENRGRADRLLSVSSQVADNATLYSPESAMGIPLPATGKSSLASDGAHIILSGIKGEIADGRLLPVQLHFDQAGVVNAKALLTPKKLADHSRHAGLYGMGDICTVGEGEPIPQISLDVEPIKGAAGWKIIVNTQQFVFDKALVDGPHVPGTGHAHLYVGGLKIGRLYDPVATIGTLPPGEHIVRVTLNTNDHRAYVVDDKPVTASAVIKVD